MLSSEPHIPATLSLRLNTAKALGWTATCLDPETRWLWQLRRGDEQLVLFGSLSPLNHAGAARLAADKHHTATILAAAGLRVAEGVRCLRPGVHLSPISAGDPYASQRGVARGEAFAAAAGYPVIVKPNRGSRGRGVTLVEDPEALRAAVEEVWAMDTLALVQRAIPGVDLRVDMLDGELLLAYLRRPLRLVGDGASTVAQLLAGADARGEDPDYRARLRLDPLWRSTLEGASLELGEDGGEGGVPAAGQVLDFPATVLNLNRCCTAEVFGALAPGWIALARRVGAAMGMRHWGMDLRIADGPDPLASDPEQAVVLEVNASPVMVQVHRMGSAALAERCEARITAAILDGATRLEVPR